MIEDTQHQHEERVLIVDDDDQIRRLLTRILEGAGYRCEVAASSAEGRAKLAADTFALMLCDVYMPGGSGLDLVDEVRCGPSEIATLVVSGEDSEEVSAQALALEVYGYVVKPFKRSELLINVDNAFIRQRLEYENRELRRSTEEIRQSREQTIRRLSRAVEYRDPETGIHLEHMSRYCALLASRLGVNPHTILVASPMHDVGKAALPDGVVLKPGSLNREERRIMERHPEAGRDILSGTASELLEVAAEIAWTHHEWFDGTGYPRGLKGEDIPKMGRIAAVADVFDALTTDRSYRPAFSLEASIEMMRAERGTHFDPTILDTFLDAIDDVTEIQESPAPPRPEGAISHSGV